MAMMLTRFCAYFTFVAYLLVGTAAVRFFMPKSQQVVFSTQYAALLSTVEIAQAETSEIEAPQMVFSPLEVPTIKQQSIAQPKAVMVSKKSLKTYKVMTAYELPFSEPVKLSPVYVVNELPVNFIALYRSAPAADQTLLAEVKPALVEDQVQNKMADAQEVDADPVFFEYPVEDTKKEEASQTQTQTAQTETKEINIAESAPVVDNSDSTLVTEEVSVTDLVVYDYSKSEVSQPSVKQPVATPSVARAPVTNYSNQGVSFDYSAAKSDLAQAQTPKYAVNTQPTKSQVPVPQGQKALTQDEYSKGFLAHDANKEDQSANAFLAQDEEKFAYPTQITIQVEATDLKGTESVKGFEVRFQDDLSQIVEDYGAGEVVLKEEMASPKMTRSISILKRGFIPTNTDLIMEEGVAALSLPLIEERVFNEISHDYGSRGLIGAVLVELDEKTEVAQLDVPFGKVLHLDGDLKKTQSGDYRYQLFLGVQAGNALLTYKHNNGQDVKKIIHVHEHEVTFDSNFYETVPHNKFQLVEEDLLAREAAPLIISSEQVRVFASNKKSKKINDHTYKMDLNMGHLAGRSYLELLHHKEPVYVGLRDNKKIVVPSENFMRFVLSNFKEAKLGNRCLVQINLSKKAESMEIGSESTAASLMTATQVLDSDGKFYDSIGEKTRKIIIVGENQGAPGISPDAKINVKIQFQDGTRQYLSSYCSPNTYLVEQL
jgi:hypothetical protein